MQENEPVKETLLGMFPRFHEQESSPAKFTRADISYDPTRLMPLKEIQELDKKFILQTYARMPVSFAYGSGEFLYDADGTEYIDFLSGIAVTALGHANADLIGALTHQADLLWHTSNLFHNQQQALLARALVEINFPGKVFFCNSGTEANEAAFKLMRAYGQKRSSGSGDKKVKIIALENSFHGRTFGAMSLTGQDKIHSGFGPIVPEVVYVPVNDIDALKKAFDAHTCGFICELIQGEGGVLPLNQEFVAKARELCDQYSALFCVDEIQTGLGRSGYYFSYQAYGFLPDIVTMAKGLGGGFPIGAMLVAERFTDAFEVGMHGSTFGGNHLATAVGYEVIRTIENNRILDNVREMSIYLVEKLEQLRKEMPQVIQSVRGMGLLLGIVLRDDIDARSLISKMLEKKIVVGRAGTNVIRLAPPLVLRTVTIDRAVDAIASVLREI
ncbi:MAG: aspartate aminotransferase family protein [Leptospiraceae bacterium]|nr:aspartate aminotransferase family protein [Leptospiraceae bacterium]